MKKYILTIAFIFVAAAICAGLFGTKIFSHKKVALTATSANTQLLMTIVK